jgi:hypothetical protein
MKNYAENKFIVDYSTDHLYLFFLGSDYHFDLNDGDPQDYWNSFEFEGRGYDVNLYIEDENELPQLTVYHLKMNEEGFWETDHTRYFIIDLCEEFGSREKYVNGYNQNLTMY